MLGLTPALSKYEVLNEAVYVVAVEGAVTECEIAPQSDQPVNSLVTAAHPGQVLTLWGTGLGAVSGKEADGPLPGNLDVPVNVYVGTKLVTPTYKGRSGCCAGIDQVVFTVPDDPIPYRDGAYRTRFTIRVGSSYTR